MPGGKGAAGSCGNATMRRWAKGMHARGPRALDARARSSHTDVLVNVGRCRWDNTVRTTAGMLRQLCC